MYHLWFVISIWEGENIVLLGTQCTAHIHRWKPNVIMKLSVVFLNLQGLCRQVLVNVPQLGPLSERSDAILGNNS